MDLLVSRGRRSRDAYVALGLRADCADEEIRKNYGKICGLLQHVSGEIFEPHDLEGEQKHRNKFLHINTV